MNKKERIKLVDVAKGLSIILVALHHSTLSLLIYEINATLALFRIPLFFFLSGVFFSPSIKFSKFVSKKSDGLLKPYFVTLLLLLIIPSLFNNENSLLHFISIFYGTGRYIKWTWVPLWFLTHLWTIFMISYLFFYIVKPTHLGTIKKALIVSVFFVLGLAFLGRLLPIETTIFDNKVIIKGLPFNLDIAFLSTSYFLSGYFLCRSVKEFIPKSSIILLSILTILLVRIFTDAEISFYNKIYNIPFFATLGAIAGIYIMLSLSYYISKNNFLSNILSKFGFASLIVLIFHNPTNIFFQKIFNSDSISLTILSFLLCLIIPLFIKKVIVSNRILKFLYLPIKNS